MLRPGDTFERYTIDAVIGQGGMGSVYRAHDARLDRRVAIKVISDGAGGEDANARLMREARAAAALDHPNAVSIFDVGEAGGAPYIVMELVSGRTLREAISADPGDVATRVTSLTDVARALAAAHKRGLIHRDIKPENVMVREDGVVKVLDFGIARRAKTEVDPSAPTQGTALPTLTKEGVKVGTPVYMAPEQIRGDALDGRVDQFAWGVLAFEVLTGRLPWRGAGDPLSAVASILTDEPPREELAKAGVSREVEAVVLRALSKRAEDRFASMDEVVRALDAAVKGEMVSGPRPVVQAAAAPAASSPTLAKRYSTEEVKQILTRAVEQQESRRADSRLAFDDLVAAAREVGVDPETLREASREMRLREDARLTDAQERDAWIRKKRRGFYRHLAILLVVQTAIFLVAATEGGKGRWNEALDTLKMGLMWGIGVGIHGISAFMAGDDEWQEEKKKRAAKEAAERKKQRRSEAIDRALDEGANLILKTGSAIRQRISPQSGQAASSESARMRIAGSDTDAGREEAAEHEAEHEAAEHEGAERRESKRRWR